MAPTVEDTPPQMAPNRKDNNVSAEKPYSECRVLTISCLISVATIIGSGILALPVTMYHTSVPLFLLLFTFSLISQIAVIIALVELMQRARRAVVHPSQGSPITTPSPSISSTSSATHSSAELASPNYNAIPNAATGSEISLFTLAHLYMKTPLMRYAFYACTILGFVAILVSYGLAGPQAIWQLMSFGRVHENPPIVIYAVYWAIGTFAVLFFVDHLLGVFSSLTVLKGVLFVGVVIIIAALPASARVASAAALMSDFSGWSSAGSPFLMSSVALGGLANTLPVTYRLLPISPTRVQLSRYRACIILAAVLCYLLNVGWVIAVLQVVPRTDIKGRPNLATAFQKGEISTVPLLDALHAGNAVTGTLLKAVSVVVALFILVSTAVSFFVTAAGLKNFLDGGLQIVAHAGRSQRWRSKQKTRTVITYALAFGSIGAIILLNPNGLIAILTRFASFSLNLQGGLLVFVMLFTARRMTSEFRSIDIEGDPGPDDQADGSIELQLSAFTANAIIIVGSIFFAIVCIIAAVGPLFGIKLSTEEG